jgi:hypothetical protein
MWILANLPPLDMVASIYSGVLSGGAAPLASNCPTGNCTWPLTPSLAVCGGCVNTTYSGPDCFCSDSNGPPWANVTTDCPVAEQTWCNYTLPSGSVATLSNTTFGTAASAQAFRAIAGQGGHFNKSGSRLYLANFDLVGVPYYSLEVGGLNVSSTECALWMCVQTYNTSVVSTVQQQTVAATHDNITAAISSNYYSARGNITFPTTGLPGDANGQTNYTVYWLALEALQGYLQTALNGTGYIDLEAPSYGTDLIRGIWNGTTNSEVWISNLALSMTNVIRSTSTTSRDVYNGTAFQLGVNVRWWWLSLPYALVVCSILLLIVVVVKTYLNPSVRPWKGNPLTFLLFEVEQEIREAGVKKLDEHRGVERAVGERRVKLIKQVGDVWKFKAC